MDPSLTLRICPSPAAKAVHEGLGVEATALNA